MTSEVIANRGFRQSALDKKRSPITDQSMEVIVNELAAGVPLRIACMHQGTNVNALSNFIKRNSDKWANRIKEALQYSVDVVEECLYHNATVNMSVGAQTFYLKNKRPEQWSDRVQADVRLSVSDLFKKELVSQNDVDGDSGISFDGGNGAATKLLSTA